MLNLDSIDSREDFKWDLIERAVKDPAFSSSLKQDPGQVLERELGKDAASGLTITVHQETPSKIYFLINYNPTLPEKADEIKVNPDDNPEAVLVKKAWKDPQYRQDLLRDPAAKLLQEFGSGLPQSTTLTVLEERRNQLHLILPAATQQGKLRPDGSSAELSDAELDQVAGGGLWSWIATKLGYTSGSCTSTSCGGCNVSASGVRG